MMDDRVPGAVEVVGEEGVSAQGVG
jgi:hypothetical protein